MDTRLTPGAAPKRMKPFTTFKLVCPSFRNGGKIPPRFTSDGADISPVLAWVDPPEDTKQFALIMEEPDAPQNERTHWIVYGIPPDAAGLPEGLAKAAQLPDRIFQGKNDFGQIGYAGPRQAPPVSHRYFFQIFALNADIKLHAGAVIQEFKAALRGKILATANLAASYEASPCKPINDAVAAGEVDAATDVPDENPLPSVLKKRLLALNTDKEFILQTNRCQTELKEAYKQNPKAVEDFFKRFSLTSAFAEGRIRKYFMAEPDQNVRQPLADYVRYANRFRVQFRLRTSPLEFRLRPLISYGEKFHVELVKGHLEGMDKRVAPDDSFVEYFSSDNVNVPRSVQELITAGKATFVRLDDHGGYSIFKDLERFAYKDDGVAIIHHHAEQPYFVCIFGEKTKKDVLARLGKLLTEFQNKYYSRPKGGRPPKLDLLKKRLEVDAKPMSNKEKAADLAEGGDEKKIKAQEVKLSQLRSKMRKSKR